jgi:hypothetical protein
VSKTVLFTFESDIGTFWIRPEPADRVLLGLDRHRLGTYSSAKAAAEAVAEQKTGWSPWDDAVDLKRPRSLKVWKRPSAKLLK